MVVRNLLFTGDTMTFERSHRTPQTSAVAVASPWKLNSEMDLHTILQRALLNVKPLHYMRRRQFITTTGHGSKTLPGSVCHTNTQMRPPQTTHAQGFFHAYSNQSSLNAYFDICKSHRTHYSISSDLCSEADFRQCITHPAKMPNSRNAIAQRCEWVLLWTKMCAAPHVLTLCRGMRKCGIFVILWQVNGYRPRAKAHCWSKKSPTLAIQWCVALPHLPE